MRFKISRKTKIKLAVSLAALFACIAIICVILINMEKPKDSQSGQSKTSPEATSQSASTTTTKPSNSSAVSATQTTAAGQYVNREFGFTLNFGEEWDGYTVSKGETKDLAGFVDSLEFKLPDVSLTPLTIYIFDKQSNESVLTQIRATFISRSSKYLYGYSTWESSPSELVRITDKSIANLIATFQLM